MQAETDELGELEAEPLKFEANPERYSERRPRIAVCISGHSLDPELSRATADAVLRQEYQGQVALIVPDGVLFDKTAVNENRVVVVAPGTSATSELGCKAVLEAALALEPPADFVAVLGSGETAPPRWLSSLLEAQEEFDADLVMGCLKAVFTNTPPDWILAGGFFDRCGIQRGPTAKIFGPDNLLIRVSAVRASLKHACDAALPPRENDWSLLECHLRDLGLTSVWANDAVVFDIVPQSRMNPEWLIDREYGKAFAVARAQSGHQNSQLTERYRPIVALALSVAGLVSRGLAGLDEARSVRARLMLARLRGIMAGSMSCDHWEKEAA